MLQLSSRMEARSSGRLAEVMSIGTCSRSLTSEIEEAMSRTTLLASPFSTSSLKSEKNSEMTRSFGFLVANTAAEPSIKERELIDRECAREQLTVESRVVSEMVSVGQFREEVDVEAVPAVDEEGAALEAALGQGELGADAVPLRGLKPDAGARDERHRVRLEPSYERVHQNHPGGEAEQRTGRDEGRMVLSGLLGRLGELETLR